MKAYHLAALALLYSSGTATAQTVQDLAGTWTVVKIEMVRPDGTRAPAFGDNPHTQLILTAAGHFSQFFIRSDIPKFASGNRLTGTAEENAAVVKGSSAAFGTFTVQDKVATLKIEGSTYPNWTGTTQMRPIVKFSADELIWTVPAASGGNSIETVWKRLK